MELAWKINDDKKHVNLKDLDANATQGYKKSEAAQELEKLGAELTELQELLAAAQHHSLLIVLQGMDTSGKDGTVRHVLSFTNPQGCEVHSFKVPTTIEANHDFLWRIHLATPAKGMMGIFNRSHYEDVLITRVHNLVPEEVWSQRYKQIRNFEDLLVANNTIILKFFLHISYEEQAKRLQARVDNPDKAWKLSVSDWKERKYWNDYQKAYEDAISKCGTDEAPWYIVPSNNKWYRNLAIADTIVKTMKKYKDEWHQELQARGKQELEQFKAFQKQGYPL